MIDIPVVLVLGAGASRPYGFPLGGELVREAINNSSELEPILAGIHDALAMQLDEFLTNLRAANPTSIDAFMAAHSPRFDGIGKAVIAYHLIKNEDPEKFDDVSPEVDWYQHFLHEMLLSNDFDGFGFNKITILTYNYDRSLEYSIFKMLRGLGHSDDDCRQALRWLNIRHLHGQIGYLPEIHDEGRPYESRVDVARLKLAMWGIRDIPKSVENDPVFQDTCEPLRKAKHVIFLGFGYLDQNVANLNLQENRMRNTSYWGTGVGVPPAVATRLSRRFPKNDSGEGPTHITIDTKIESVKDYLLDYPYLFTE